jgi:hypothetical protein
MAKERSGEMRNQRKKMAQSNGVMALGVNSASLAASNGAVASKS